MAAAEFRSEEGNWERVALPHERSDRGGSGTYRLHFELPAAPPADGPAWALRCTHLSTLHHITLNGQTVSMQMHGAANRLGAKNGPLLVDVAPVLLRPGLNEIVVEQQFPVRGGLAPMQLGPKDVLAHAHSSHQAWSVQTPQILNVATLGLACFMLLIWWRRPVEEAIGVFGLMWLPTAVRNYSYLVSTSALPSRWVAAVVFCIGMEVMLLSAIFAIALAGAGWVRMRRLLWRCTLVPPVVAAVGAAYDITVPLRQVVYPLLLPALLFALWLFYKELARLRSRLMVVVWSTIAASIVAGVHDYLLVRGDLGLQSFYWMPWAMPMLFVAFSVLLMGRLVAALGAAEGLNQELERRVAERTAELAAANQAKTRFIASTSHDLRQPLHSVGLLVGQLGQRLRGEPERAILHGVETSLTAMESLLNSVLDISRLDGGAETAQVTAVSLAALFQEIERSFGPLALQRGLRLHLHHRDLWVVSDAHLLWRVLNNLVSNAFRFTAAGGVLVSARARGEQVWLEVTDTGVGIPGERLQDVFLEFVQLDNPERDRNKGLGLGLAIVQRIAKMLDHPLAVYSRVGHGTRFRLSLPRVASVRPSVSQTDPGRAPMDWDISGLFVLLVDDERDIQFAMQGLLGELGCRVLTAGDGAQALAALEKQLRTPDAIILDYRLPDTNGVALAPLLHAKLDGPVPTLIMSGDVATDALQAMRDAGLKLLHKPVPPGDLLAWLQAVKQRQSDAGRSVP